MIQRLLVVEDELDMRRFYERFLKKHRDELNGCVVESADQALSALSTETFELMIVDWGLPGISGIDLIKALRSHRTLRTLGILMVTAARSANETVIALKAGADDFIAKPFDEKVLLARVKGLVRRSELTLEAHGVFKLPGLEFRPDSSELTIDGKTVVLRLKESELLKILLSRPNMVHTHIFLWDALWGYESDGWLHVLASTVSSLRQKLGPRWALRLQSHKRKGYLFKKTPQDLMII